MKTKLLPKFQTFMSGYPFAISALTLTLGFTLLGILILLLPPSLGNLSQFAQNIKVWCFGFNPTTGSFQWTYLAIFFSGPLVITTTILLLWKEPLQKLQQQPRKAIPYLAASTLLLIGISYAFFQLYQPPTSTSKPLPSLKHLRTHTTPTPFQLINQDGQKIALKNLLGKVILITGVYSTCKSTCPLIMAQTRSVVQALSQKEKENLQVLVITLNPEEDTPPKLKKMAQIQHTPPPLYQYLTGKPKYVHKILDQYGFLRKKNPKTGVISHVNLFILIDKQGKIAFRFLLGEKQKKLTIQAIQKLIQEKIPKKIQPTNA